jgi:5-methylcytosine-specific restriction endonuclease McrA
MATHKRNWQGSKWCRPEKRLAIYLRDGFICVYCGREMSLSLDHVIPHALGGGNEASNLVTACKPCNSARGKKTVRQFLAWLRVRGADTAGLAARVRNCTRRRVDMAAGKRLLARRKAL